MPFLLKQRLLSKQIQLYGFANSLRDGELLYVHISQSPHTRMHDNYFTEKLSRGSSSFGHVFGLRVVFRQARYTVSDIVEGPDQPE